MPLLSVIVPVYNAQQYLRDCLDSILSQTFTDFELICVNDGSEDCSLQILKEYEQRDKRVVVFDQHNRGAASARNLGLQNSKGQYITFVDSDDCLETKAYESALKYIDDVDVVCFGIKTFGEDFNKKTQKSDNEYYQLKYDGNVSITDKLIKKTDLSVCNKIFKRSIIDGCKLYFPEGLHYEDAAFCWKYFLSSKNIYFLNEYFYKYRRHSGSIMHTTFKNCDYAVEHLDIIDDLFEFLKRESIFCDNLNLFLNLFRSCFVFAYTYSPELNKKNILEKAANYADKFFAEMPIKNHFLTSLKNRDLERLFEPDLSFVEQIFSLKNVYVPDSQYKHKLICFMGVRFRIKVEKKEVAV